jgi:hypothetical protein
MEGPPRPKVLPLDPEFIASILKTEEQVVIPLLAAAAAAQQTLPIIKSPKPPSAEGLAMEKSWVPKRVETESPKNLPKLSTSPVSQMKPSPKALEMGKQWSHRFTSHSSKIWPPPPPENEPPSIPIWNSGQQSSSSLISSSNSVIETTTTTHQQQVESVTKKSILKSSTGGPGPALVVDHQQPHSKHVKIQGDESDQVVAEIAKVIPVISTKPALKSLLESPQKNTKEVCCTLFYKSSCPVEDRKLFGEGGS